MTFILYQSPFGQVAAFKTPRIQDSLSCLGKLQHVTRNWETGNFGFTDDTNRAMSNPRVATLIINLPPMVLFW